MLNNGNPNGKARGGKRKNAGRKPTHAKDYIENLCGDKLYARLWEIGNGGKIEQWIDKELRTIPAPACVQVDALKYLANRKDGMPTQNIESDSITEILREMRERIRA